LRCFWLNKTIVRIDKIVIDKKKPIGAAIDEFRLAMDNANLFLQIGSALVN